MYKYPLRELLLSQTWQHDDSLSDPNKVRTYCYDLMQKAKLEHRNEEVTLQFIKNHNYNHNCQDINYDKDVNDIYNLITNNGTRRMFLYKSEKLFQDGKCDFCDPDDAVQTFIGFNSSIGKIHLIVAKSIFTRGMNDYGMIDTKIISYSDITLKQVLEYNIELINDLLVYENIDIILQMIEN